MGRLKDLVSKVRDEVAPLASAVREEVVHQVRERVLNTPKAQAATSGSRDEWAFTPVERSARGEGGAQPESTQAAGGAAPNGNGASTSTPAAPATKDTAAKREDAPSPSASGVAAAPTNGVAAAPDGSGSGALSPASSGVSAGGAAPTQAAPGQGTPAPAAAAQIKITAQPSPTDPTLCKFTVEVPVFEERMIRIRDREAAVDSPLAQRLFEIPQVSSVTFSGTIITLSKAGPEPWPMIARQVGPAIRAHIASGQPALTKEPEAVTVDASSNEELRAKVQHVIESLINPGVASHGGYVTLLGVEADTAYISMGGGCQGCGMADVTLKQGITQTIMSQVPEIVQVLDSTDHSSGDNPFFASGK